MGRLVAGVLILLLPLAGAQAWETDPANDVSPEGTTMAHVDVINVTMEHDAKGLRLTMALNGTIRDAPITHTLDYLFVFTFDDQGASLYQSNDGTIVCTVTNIIRCHDSQERTNVVEAGENGTHVWAVVQIDPVTPSDQWKVAGGATAKVSGELVAQDFTQSFLPGQANPGGDQVFAPDTANQGDKPFWQNWMFWVVAIGIALVGGELLRQRLT